MFSEMRRLAPPAIVLVALSVAALSSHGRLRRQQERDPASKDAAGAGLPARRSSPPRVAAAATRWRRPARRARSARTSTSCGPTSRPSRARSRTAATACRRSRTSCRRRRSSRSQHSSPPRPARAGPERSRSSRTTRRSRTARTRPATSRRSATSPTTTGRRRRSRSWTSSQRHERHGRGGLPPDRAQDRRRRAPLLQGRRGQGVRRRQRHVRLRLLPRPAAVEARRSPRRPGGGHREHRLQGPEHRGERVHLLPVQPRPRPRPDALHGARPAAGARLLPQAADRGGLDHVQRRSLHGEPELLVRAALEVAEHEEPALPLQQQVRASGRTSSTATC